MALENYCAACHHLSEKEHYKEFFCYIKSRDVKATDTKCSRFLEEGKRKDDKRIEMYKASGGYYKPGCYLTTAMCYILGYEDDNYYLQTLRTFRDTVLKQDPRYIPLLLTYDVIGPMIAAKLLEDPNNKMIANILLTRYISKAVDAIEEQQTEIATNIYVAMTHYLADRYNINTKIITIDPTNIDMETLGKGRIRKRTLEEETL